MADIEKILRKDYQGTPIAPDQSLTVNGSLLLEAAAEIERLRGLVDACAIYLKEDETPAQRIERERADTQAVLKLLLKEKREIERLRELVNLLKEMEHQGVKDE